MRLILSRISRNMPNTLSSSQAMDNHSGFSEEDFVIKQSICSGSRILLYLPRVFCTISYGVQNKIYGILADFVQLINRGVKLTRFFTRKSSCVTVRGSVQRTGTRSPVWGDGVPLPVLPGGVLPLLAGNPHGRTWDRILDRTRGYPPERTWGQRLGCFLPL